MRGRVGVRVDRDLVERARRLVADVEFSVYLESLLLTDLDRRSAEGGFSWRDEANAITAIAFRPGLLDQLHSGRRTALRDDPISRPVADVEMRKFTIESSAKIEGLLRLRERNPAAYALLIRREHHAHCRDWESDGGTGDVLCGEGEQFFGGS